MSVSGSVTDTPGVPGRIAGRRDLNGMSRSCLIAMAPSSRSGRTMVGRSGAPNRDADGAGSGYAASMSRLPSTPFVLFGLAFVLVGCLAETAASFDPTGPCVTDGSAPGGYPELESRLPQTYRDAPPNTVDSGRNCSGPSLGSLAQLGFEELRFAGATWSFGAERAVVMAVFAAPGLDADAIADFYTESARTANRTEVLAESSPSIAGRPGRRLDTKTVERLQTVVVWPAAESDFVNVVITNDLPDARVDEAIEAFGDR